MNDITRLVATDAIKTLKAHYCRLVDTKQWDALEGLFADHPTMVFQHPDGTVLHAFDDANVFAHGCRFLNPATSSHQVHNAEVTITSATTASAVFAMEDRIYFPAAVASDFTALHGLGYYHETYEQVAGHWKIKTLRLERLKLDVH